MKIKKHGSTYINNQDKTEEFVCQNCGCKFTVKNDEYYIDYGGADNSWVVSSSITYTWSSTIKDYYVCSCPECHKIVKKVHERQNYNYCTTTLSGTCTADSTTSTIGELNLNDIKITSDKACVKSTLTI